MMEKTVVSEDDGCSPGGLGKHVPARVMGQFAIFFPGYGSCFVYLALVMAMLYRDCFSHGQTSAIDSNL